MHPQNSVALDFDDEPSSAKESQRNWVNQVDHDAEVRATLHEPPGAEVSQPLAVIYATVDGCFRRE